jgi:hypothetical protein
MTINFELGKLVRKLVRTISRLRHQFWLWWTCRDVLLEFKRAGFIRVTMTYDFDRKDFANITRAARSMGITPYEFIKYAAIDDATKTIETLQKPTAMLLYFPGGSSDLSNTGFNNNGGHA